MNKQEAIKAAKRKLKMTKREAIKKAKSRLKVSGIPGIWNFWLLEDGTLHREYQCGQGAWFLLEKDDSGKIYELDQDGCGK